jgi:death-on-curing family protein
MNLDEQYLTETNEQILKNHEKLTGQQVWIEVIPKNISRVFPKVNSVGNSGNKGQDLVEKAAHIMAVIPWAQAFFDGNRRTGIVAARTFLHDNGYDLDIDPEDENLELRKLLSEIKKQSMTLNQDIVKQLSFYISKRMKPL